MHELEIEMEGPPVYTLETINQLLYLYSQAVEYFNGINDEKFQYYHERIQNVLLKPQVIQLMSQKLH